MRTRMALRGVLVGVVALAAGLAHGAPPQVLHQGIVHDALYDVCFDARGGVAVGAAGVVLESDAEGSAWQPRPGAATPPVALLGVACGATRRIAVGQMGTLLVDDGAGWRAVASGTDQRLLAVALNNAGLAVAVGAFGTVLASHDGGDSWATIGFDWPTLVEDYADPHLYDVAVGADGVITLVGEFEIVMRSPDAGATWVRAHKGDASLFGLHLDASGTGFAVGQQGRVLRTRDGGQNWDPIAAPADTLLLGVWASSEGRVLVSGMRTMLESSDAGASWRVLEGEDLAVGWYAGVAPAHAAQPRVISVGNAGRVLALPIPAL